MNEQTLLNIINQIEPEIFWLLIKIIAIGITISILRGYINNIASYIQFRLDKRLGQGVKVQVRGIKGKIVNYNISWVFVKSEDGQLILINMSRWKFEQWQVITNGDKINE